MTSYISFCEGMCVPTKTYCIFNNNKPWFTAMLKWLRQAKEEAFRSGDRILYNQARNTLTKEIRGAKRSYSDKEKNRFSANDPASVWRGLQDIANYRKTSPHPMEKPQLADNLNVFYCRFDHPTFTPLTCSNSDFTQSSAPPVITSPLPSVSPPALTVFEEDVCQLFQRQKTRKASGPDGVSPSCLKACADQLAPIFTQIFNRSLELCEVPSCFKRVRACG